MAVDPEISLGLKPLASPFSSNPLETVGAIQGLQAQQNQLKQFATTYAARQKAGQIIASAPTLAAGLDAASKDPDVMGFAGDVYNVAREAQLAQTRVAGETQEQGLRGYGVFTKSLSSTLTNPDSFGPNAATALSLTSPAAKASVDSAIRNVHAALTTGLPDPQQDPQGYQQGLAKNITSTMLGAGGFGADQLHAIVGSPTTQDLGGQKVAGVQAPSQGAPSMLGGAAPGSFTPTSQLSLSLPPQVQPLTSPSGKVTPTLIGGAYGVPGGSDSGGQIALPGGNPLMSSQSGQLPPVPQQLLNQLGTPTSAAARNPLGAGVPLTSGGPTATQQVYQGARGKTMADYQEGLDQAVSSGNTLLQNLSEARDALKTIKTGGGADTYVKLAQLASGLGASQSVIDKIGLGNQSSAQEFQKLMVNTTNAQIKQQLGGMAGGHLGQQEFDTFQKNNPNLETDPRAIDKIFNYWTKVYQRNAAEQSQMGQFVKGGGDISDWPAEWQTRSKALGYIDPAKTDSTQSAGARPALADIFK